MLIDFIFSKLYRSYSFPFQRSDARIIAMPDAEKTEYYRQAKDLLDNRVYIQEMQELIRQYYQELALKTNGKVEQQAYRLTLKAIQDFDVRLHNLASLYKTPALNRISKQL